jgi:hypothetical protein
MAYSEYNYEPSDINDEMFLSDVPVDVLKESITTQFENPLEYRKRDYLQSYITKYVISKDNMDEDELETLQKLDDGFISFMCSVFDKYLDISINDIDQLPTEDQHELLQLVYRFFIKMIKKNFVNVVINYIDRNKEDLCDLLPKKKDVTTMTFKAEIDDDNDVLILANLKDVIRIILLETDFGVDEFLDLCIPNGYSLEYEFVKSKFDDFTLVGNFVEKYVKMIDLDFFNQLESKIRNRILKRYPIRKKEKVD